MKLALFLSVVLMLLQGCSGEPNPLAAPRTPRYGVAYEMAPSESHTYVLSLEEGDYLEVAVDQQGVDVVTTLYDPLSNELFQVDSPSRDRGRETVLFVAETTGDYRLVVSAGPRYGPGRYVLESVAERRATGEDHRRAAAAELFQRAEALQSGDPAATLVLYEQALDRWRILGDQAWVAETWDRLGRVHYRLGQWPESVDALERGAALFESLGEIRRQAAVRDLLGRGFREMGEMERALQDLQQALALWREVGDAVGQARTWTSLGFSHRLGGEAQKALDAYGAALELWRETGSRDYEGRALHNLGALYVHLGRDRRALDTLESAARVQLDFGDVVSRGSTLDLLGKIRLRLGDVEGALESLHEAQRLRVENGDPRRLAYTLANLAAAYRARGETDRSRSLMLEALDVLTEVNDVRGQAQVLWNLGVAEHEEGKPRLAAEYLEGALARFREIGDPHEEAASLAKLAAVRRLTGDLETARRHLESALDVYERLRRSVRGQELRTSYFATLQAQYDAYVDLLMELHEREPGARHAARALEVSERTRGRSLLEELERAAARREVDPAWLERERAIQDELNTMEKLRLDGNDLGAKQRAWVERRLRQLAEELSALRGYESVDGREVVGEPLGMEEMRTMLDARTVLLVLHLGDERSFLWVVDPVGLRSFVLPPRRRIEDAARDVYRYVTRSHRPESRAASRFALCRLSRLLIAPAAAAVDGKRLLVVADGAVQYVPFAALPDLSAIPGPVPEDCAGAPPLVLGHEIVSLPSASVVQALAAESPEAATRSFATRSIAIFADPVFDASDFRRLSHSHKEAEAILALAGSDDVLLATGFAARKSTVLSGALAGRHVLHFATHGVLEPDHPELSHLVLTQVDETGAALDGRLFAHEIYGLELDADLVVLSACRSALGKPVPGEGLVGLTRGFLHAGARRVVVSLWNVDDRVTAELMEAFYRRHLREGLPPAAALREAQVSLWEKSSRKAPYYWAGFVLQGEWRG